MITQTTFLLGDCQETLKQLKEKSVDCVITSPPYDNLRNYEGFTFQFEEIANQLYRVMKDGAVMVWIVGDATIDRSETLTSFKQALYFKEIGFNLHDTMIYQKNNFSNPSKGRYHQIFEYMFVLAKGKPKTFNPLIDRKNIYAGSTALGKNTTRGKDGQFTCQPKRVIQEYGMRYNIWKGNTSGQENMCKHIDHPATFPLWLVKDHILSWSDPGNTVLDPFMGSGTTGVACIELNRHFIGCEIENQYMAMAKDQIERTAKELQNDLFNSSQYKTA